jgi:hypothetical protein
VTLKPLAGSLANGGLAHFWKDTDDGGQIVSAQDLSPVIEANKAAYGHNDGYTKTREMRRVAFLPDIIRQKWLNEEGWDAYDPDCAHKLMRKLNDPDWLYLRTAPGTLGKTEDGFR